MATFFDRVSALFTRDAKNADICTDLARYAVKRAYQPDNGFVEVQFMLDSANKLWIAPLIRFFAGAGLLVEWKAGKPAICNGMKYGRAHQAKAFEWIAAHVVTNVDDVIKKEKPVKELTGLAADRAKKGIESFITRLKKSDPDAAAIANEMLSAPKEVEVEVASSLTLVGPNGETWDLDNSDYEVLRDTMIARLSALSRETPSFERLIENAGQLVAAH